MSKKIFFRFLIVLLVILLAPFIFFAPKNTFGATVNYNVYGVGEDAPYCFVFDNGDEIGLGDYLEIEFAPGFDLTNLTISDTNTESEIGLYLSGATCGGSYKVEAVPADDGGGDTYIHHTAAIDGNKIRIEFDGTVDPGANFTVTFGDESDANSYSVKTPGSAGNYQVIFRWGTDSTVAGVDSNLLYVGGANEVEIYATVDPILSLTISETACDLGTFGTGQVNTCNYHTQVSTNATGGYIAYIRDDGNLRNSSSDEISDITSGIGPNNTSIDYGYEEYGVATDSPLYTLAEIDQYITNANCIAYNGGTTPAPAADLTTSDQTFHGSDGPVDADVCNLCHAASISGSTEAGVYAHTITITVIGNF